MRYFWNALGLCVMLLASPFIVAGFILGFAWWNLIAGAEVAHDFVLSIIERMDL